MSRKKSFRAPTKFSHTVSESDLQSSPEQYQIVLDAAYVELHSPVGAVSMPRRIFDRLVEFYQQEALPHLK